MKIGAQVAVEYCAAADDSDFPFARKVGKSEVKFWRSNGGQISDGSSPLSNSGKKAVKYWSNTPGGGVVGHAEVAAVAALQPEALPEVVRALAAA